MLLPAVVPLTKRLPFHKGELSAKLTEGCPIPPSRLAPCHLPFPFGKKEAFGRATSFGGATSQKAPLCKGSCRR